MLGKLGRLGRAGLGGGTIAPPAAPTALPSDNVTDESFNAKWDASASATGYRLDVSESAVFATYVTGFQDKTVSGTNQAVTGLTAGKPYYYRVRAVNAGGTSVNSNTITTFWLPSDMANTSLFVDCMGSLNETGMVGATTVYAKLWDYSANARHITPATDAAKPPVAMDGGITCAGGAQILPLASAATAKTVIVAYKPIAPNLTLSVMLYNTASAVYVMKTIGTLGGGNGIALQSGTTQYLAMTETATADAKNIIALANVLNEGIVRKNRASATRVESNPGTNDSITFSHITTHAGNGTYSFRGILYGIYTNTAALSLAAIQKVEAWMATRYTI